MNKKDFIILLLLVIISIISVLNFKSYGKDFDRPGPSSLSVSFNLTVSAVSSSTIYFENGTCKCPNATVGETATISGTTYTVVDNSTIQGEVDNGNVLLCTSLVTDMTDLFKGKSEFNSNINFWDTSNVTDITNLFYEATSFNQDLDNWDTSSIITMVNVFLRANSFNGDIFLFKYSFDARIYP